MAESILARGKIYGPTLFRPAHGNPSHRRDIDLYVATAYISNQPTTNDQEANMLAFGDVTQEIDERNTERMNFRTKPRIKKIIQQAAALSGVDDSVFTMNAAYRSAMETIAAHERTILQPVDHAALFAALDNPPAATDRLQEAFNRHRKTVVSR